MGVVVVVVVATAAAAAGAAAAGAAAAGAAAGGTQKNLFIDNWRRLLCLQCFDAVGWAAGRASGL